MQPYTPIPLPPLDIDCRRLIRPVSQANFELARFDGILEGITNADLLLSPLTKEDAVRSSRIEGTQATLNDVLEYEAGISKSDVIREDIQEIQNYREAARMGTQLPVEQPITLYFIRSLHQTLMQGVRGELKSPGMFRRTQNYIGAPESTLEQASFVPPDPIRLSEFLEDFERYLQTDDDEVLIQTAIVHAQFELLHPFNDGNGRIGRLLIPLFLYHKHKLSQPVFYISGYLERHREKYYQHLREISVTGNWNDWIEFFMQAVTIVARSNHQRVQDILELYREMMEMVQKETHSQYTMKIVDELFDHPKFRVSDFIRQLGVHPNTARDALNRLRDAKILEELSTGKGRRSSVLAFSRLLTITGAWEINKF